MAATFGRSLGTGLPADGTTTGVLTTSAAASVGERIVVCFSWLETGTTLSSVSDSAGNTYSIDIQTQNGISTAVCSAHVTTQLSSGGTITGTWSSASVSWRNIHAFALAGIASSSAVDTTNATRDDDENMATTASNSSGTDAIIVSLFAMRDATTRTRSSGNGTQISATKGGSINTGSQYEVLTTSGNKNSTWVWSGTSNLAGIATHVIYKGGAAAEFFTKAVTVTFV